VSAQQNPPSSSPPEPNALGDQPPSGATRAVWNPFSGVHVVQAPGRMQRRELTDECPFCADITAGRVPEGTDAWIRPNDFPTFSPPTGECHILIYSRDHHRTFAELTLAEAITVVELWQRIYRQLAPCYACVMTWETFGEAIGQTQRHPHGQTYGVSFLPDTLARELAALATAEAHGQPCLYCQELRAEQGGPRVIHAGEHWLGFIPPYARYPYQVQLSARAHLPNIAALTSAGATEELAAALLAVLRAYNQLFQAPMPYMLVLHQLADPRFHLHLDLLPVGRAPGKLKLAASGEMGFGLWVNDSSPEVKAAELRARLIPVASAEADPPER
jgi:UDPglucose--hexose-1-phosphate uridylyltransferase